ncbi:MAG TPA: bifunctional metallophosphatase/5'-nucleotidase [Marmoricola sp.]|nr:bifunctional metallophosphatase/5'-nucleotidase [Marmoricola sp.]
MSTHLRRRLVGAFAAGACALAGVATMQPATAAGKHQGSQRGPLMDLQILSFNDFHGNLEPPGGSSGRLVTGHHLDPVTGDPVNDTTDVGGVAYLASHLAAAREGHPNTLTVAAGDLIGASPLLSAAFHDEPTIEAMNKLGLDVSAVGNHEFDEGYQELQRMQAGGCIDDGTGANNQDSCPDHVFKGADFDYLAANVKYAGTDQTILPAYSVRNVNGAKIGFIGMTLHDTPTIVTAAGVKGLEFTDEVKTANALVPVLEEQGVKAIVVLIHQGGVPGQQTWYGPDNQPYRVSPSYDAACANGSTLAPDSPIIPIAQQLSPQIDMVISGHTHQPYVCDIPDPAGNDRLVTSASSFGRLYTDTELKYDRRTQDIVRSSVVSNNELVTRDVQPDPEESALVATYKELVKPIASKVIGHITADVTRTGNAAGESALGDLIADAQLADPSVVTNGQTPVIAFMNPGGIRADLTAANSPYGEPSGDVTFDEAFTVQPFNNYLVSLTLTGQDIYDLLAQQVTGNNAGTNSKTLQVSQGFSYEMSPTGPVDGSVMLDGAPIDKAASYRIVTNNFLADGGDNFPAFTKGTGRYFGGLDIDAFASYLTQHNPYTPLTPTRIGGTK